jgi:hypothetical protein
MLRGLFQDMSIILAVFGIGFMANAAIMMPNVQSAIHQQLIAVYLVGGAIVFGLGVVVHYLKRVTEDLSYGVKKADERANKTS